LRPVVFVVPFSLVLCLLEVGPVYHLYFERKRLPDFERWKSFGYSHAISKQREISMNTNELKKQLQVKERELLADMARGAEEARKARGAEIQDRTDQVASSEMKENLSQENSYDWNVLIEVREALRRIEDGTFGKCADCGQQIDSDRLNAIPWTLYCLNDQNRRDHEWFPKT
jgi:DnaK suppressor protein